MASYQVTEFQFYGAAFIIAMLMIFVTLVRMISINNDSERTSKADKNRNYYDRQSSHRLTYRNGTQVTLSGDRHYVSTDWRNVISDEELEDS